MITTEQIYYKNILSKLSAIFLLIAMIPVLPYFYYQLLKFLIFGSSGFNAYLFYKSKDQKWMWIMIAIAVIFNPISPIYFGHFLWSIIDLVVSVIFFQSLKIKS